MKKIGKILLIALISVVSLLLVVWLGLWIARAIAYNDYISHKETVSKIPALGDGFVPQGLAYAEDDVYLHSGYNGDAIAIHLTVGKEEKEIIPVDKSGNVWEGHGGGITRAGKYVYVATDGQLIIFEYDALLGAQDGDCVANVGTFKVDTAASFCFTDGNRIYVGEFYRPVVYETDPAQHYTTPAGDENKAIVSCYALLEDGSIADKYPLYSISIRSQVQGFAVKDNVFILSSSWGVNSSKLDFYRGLGTAGATISISGMEVPLYYLDSSNHIKTVNMPAFSEGIDIVENRVIISFESACNKYIIGKFFFANKVVSYPIFE